MKKNMPSPGRSFKIRCSKLAVGLPSICDQELPIWIQARGRHEDTDKRESVTVELTVSLESLIKLRDDITRLLNDEVLTMQSMLLSDRKLSNEYYRSRSKRRERSISS